MEYLQMLESMWFLIVFGVGGWVHYVMGRLHVKLDEIKKETEENRNRSIAAQDVVAQNTEAIRELRLIMAEIKILLEQRR